MIEYLSPELAKVGKIEDPMPTRKVPKATEDRIREDYLQSNYFRLTKIPLGFGLSSLTDSTDWLHWTSASIIENLVKTGHSVLVDEEV